MTRHCTKCDEDKDESKFRREGEALRKSCMACDKRVYKKAHSAYGVRQWFAARRCNAIKRGVKFEICLDDVLPLPELCPVLGLPLAFGVMRARDSSPSLDRIIPSLGYVKGNVIVISMRANRIKNDATIAELQAVASFYANLSTTGNI